MPITFNDKTQTTPVTIVVVSARKAQVQALQLSLPAYERILFYYVASAGESSSFHDVCITTRKDGCALLVHVDNRNTNSWDVLDHTIGQSQNMVSCCCNVCN